MQPTEEATCATEQRVDTQLVQTVSQLGKTIGATAEHKDTQLLYESTID